MNRKRTILAISETVLALGLLVWAVIEDSWVLGWCSAIWFMLSWVFVLEQRVSFLEDQVQEWAELTHSNAEISRQIAEYLKNKESQGSSNGGSSVS